MTPTWFVGLWLAAYRLSRFALDDTLISHWRERWFRRFPPNAEYARLGRLFDEQGKPYWKQYPAPIRKVSKLGELADCYWCLGFWVSGAVVGVSAQFVSIRLPVLWWLAVSTAVGLTARNADGA